MFEGLRCFEEAFKIDPGYALALSGLADTYTMLCLHSYMSPEEAWPKAAAAANRGFGTRAGTSRSTQFHCDNSHVV